MGKEETMPFISDPRGFEVTGDGTPGKDVSMAMEEKASDKKKKLPFGVAQTVKELKILFPEGGVGDDD